MARVSIYVPDDLKERMDRAGQEINWSEIARPAFLSAVANHEHRKGKSMTTVVERLRASKEKYTAEMIGFGEEAGRRWALDDAEYEVLLRVASLSDEQDWLGALSLAMEPEGGLSLSDLADALGLLERDLSDKKFAEGFVRGAKEAFEEVKDSL